MKAVFIGLVAFSLVHSWYPQSCCSDRDCHPVPCEDILEEPNGYSYQGLLFGKEQVQLSKDRFCHVCIGKKPSGLPNPYCIFIQTNA